MFSTLRALVFLRCCARSLERIAAAQEGLHRIAQEDWNTRNVKTEVKKAVFGKLDIAAVEEQYHSRRVAEFKEE